MKTLLLVITFFFSSATMAQVSPPLYDSAAVFVNYFGLYDPPSPLYESWDFFSIPGTDTSILPNVVHRKVFMDGQYLGAMRNSGDTVYFFHKDSTSEHVAYNFNLYPGDTIRPYVLDYGHSSVDYLVVDTVTSFQDNGVYRKVIWFTGDNSWDQWISGFGCTEGLFKFPLWYFSESSVFLDCVSIGDSTIYPYPQNKKLLFSGIYYATVE
jgi:hypothetical protein